VLGTAYDADKEREPMSLREKLESCPTCGSESRNVRVCLSCNVTHPIYAHVEKTCSDSWHGQAAIDSSPQRLLLEALKEIASLAELPAGAEFHNPLAIIKTIHECAESAIKQNGDAKTKMAALDSSPAKFGPTVGDTQRLLRKIEQCSSNAAKLRLLKNFIQKALDSSVPKESAMPVMTVSSDAPPAASPAPWESNPAAGQASPELNLRGNRGKPLPLVTQCPECAKQYAVESEDALFGNCDECKTSWPLREQVMAIPGQASVSDPPTPTREKCPTCFSWDKVFYGYSCDRKRSGRDPDPWHNNADGPAADPRLKELESRTQVLTQNVPGEAVQQFFLMHDTWPSSMGVAAKDMPPALIVTSRETALAFAEDYAEARVSALLKEREAEPDWHAFYTESQTERFHEQEVTATLQEELEREKRGSSIHISSLAGQLTEGEHAIRELKKERDDLREELASVKGRIFADAYFPTAALETVNAEERAAAAEKERDELRQQLTGGSGAAESPTLRDGC
jgi:hypothetical protein